MKALQLLSNLFANGIVQENDRDNSRIHISEITGCARKLWYKTRPETPNKKSNQQMALIIGTALHGLTENIVTQMNHDSLIETEVPCSFEPEYPVIGAADIVDTDSVIDLKFLSSWNYSQKSKVTDLAYKIQVLLYGLALKKSKAYLFLVDRGNLAFTAQYFNVDKHKDELYGYLDRAKEIFNSPSIPDRAYSDRQNFECNYCPFLVECWFKSKSFDVT